MVILGLFEASPYHIDLCVWGLNPIFRFLLETMEDIYIAVQPGRVNYPISGAIMAFGNLLNSAATKYAHRLRALGLLSLLGQKQIIAGGAGNFARKCGQIFLGAANPNYRLKGGFV